MARKDNKGRNLKTGEYQRPDGRYEYRYKDEITGKRNSVYAADLASLREMEKKINKDMDDQLITDASVKKLTVNTLFERYHDPGRNGCKKYGGPDAAVPGALLQPLHVGDG